MTGSTKKEKTKRREHEVKHWSEVPQLYFEVLDFFMRGAGRRGREFHITGLSYERAVNLRQQFYRWFTKLRELQREIKLDKKPGIVDEHNYFRALFTTSKNDWRVEPLECNKIMIVLDPKNKPSSGAAPCTVVFLQRPEYAVDENLDLEGTPPHVKVLGRGRVPRLVEQEMIPARPEHVPAEVGASPEPRADEHEPQVDIDALAEFIKQRAMRGGKDEE